MTITETNPATDRTVRTASTAFSWWPCAVSTTSTSTPCASSASVLPATSPLIPTAAELSSRPDPSSADDADSEAPGAFHQAIDPSAPTMSSVPNWRTP